ncbi:hypothetical protein E1281_23065 [Actinomadura sp. KC345]|uniref:hypothetical protein n=1 Tax=Actinomadura sp. KC345 TaxID=2530371 RepID=UPI00105018E8|nr:hypothetical protein [Actinomadura sp. KC345]TDC49683.1 hypothetical protein E1281_23065 [Actinomadura sp. KC345]
MNPFGPIGTRLERHVLRWRTRRGREVAVRHLDLLAVALKPRGWRFVRLYETPEYAIPVPQLWVYASGVTDDAGVLVSVLATPGGTWGYHDSKWGRHGFLSPCGDTKAAADRVDRFLKHRLYPGTW